MLQTSDAYFRPESHPPFRLRGNELRFTSPLETQEPENNEVHARLFPSRRAASGGTEGPAVLVLPQWNAEVGSHEGLCRLLNRFGLTALKLTLPYHERRKPPEMQRADAILSPNLGGTLHACRQAVLDASCAVTWLCEAGYAPVAILGTSLGSCIAFIVFAHDERLHTAVFNHISPYFADVVWRGISTRHVRRGLEEHVTLDELRKLWLPISPWSYYDRLRERGRTSLLVYARYDLSFPVDLSRQVVAEFEAREIPHERFVLPCGHYTTAKFPFNWMDGLAVGRFLARRLGEQP